ncbi:MAG: phosphopantetheine-binding protein [Gammaproteobacteria bacterium]
MSEDLKPAIKHYILDEFLPGEDIENLTDNLPLISSGILDSIATLKLVLHLEERYGITLEAHEADKDNLDTVERIDALVRSKLV